MTCCCSLLVLLSCAVVLLAIYAHERGWGWRLQGGLNRFCYDILEFQYDHGGGVVLPLPFLSTYWVLACRQEFAGVGTEQRLLIQALFDRPIPQHVITPRMNLERAGLAKKRVSQHEFHELRTAMMADPPRSKVPRGPEGHDLTRAVLDGADGMEPDWLDYHKSFGLFGPPSQEPTVEPSEVGRALREGRLVRFNAAEVLPAGTFNVTLSSLAELHGDGGDGITILGFMDKSQKCRAFAYHFRKVNPVGALFCPALPTIGTMRRSLGPTEMPTSARIALRRLPRYVDEGRLLKALDVQGVERPEGQIIMGHANGDTHWDEQDNIFIQVSGVSAVLGVPPEYTDAITGDEKWSGKSSGMVWNEWLSADEVRKHAVPWYYMVLRPGDGIAIPSRAFHAVYGGHNRASIQTFLEPQFLGMRHGTNKHSYWYRETKPRQAVRNIYFKTLGRLWETRKIGMVAQGGIIEYL